MIIGVSSEPYECRDRHVGISNTLYDATLVGIWNVLCNDIEGNGR